MRISRNSSSRAGRADGGAPSPRRTHVPRADCRRASVRDVVRAARTRDPSRAWSTSRSAATINARRSSRRVRPDAPLFSNYVEQLAPGDDGRRSASAERGHPIASLADIPAGEYWVQPFVNVYTRFPRADGHTVWMHMDQWEGQNWKRSPGNLFGEPTKVRIDPRVADPDQAGRRQSDSADRRFPPTPRSSSASRSKARF